MNGTTVLLLENEPIRWVWLADLLQLRRNMSDVSGSELTYVILQQGHRQLAVQVDLVDEEREVLLKPLGFPLQEMDGVLGGTIQPDGSVQLVLDIGLEKVSRDLPREEPAHRETRSGATYNILIVDDSPTTRALLRNALTAAGYRVRMAVDGLDALDQMRSEKPDLVVSDFEMPRLNGVDLTRQIKSRWRIPVILVTGREQERHRLEGLDAGADAYFVKSAYRDEGLLDLIRQMIPT
jgi:FOG: CheY-like receiver